MSDTLDFLSLLDLDMLSIQNIGLIKQPNLKIIIDAMSEGDSESIKDDEHDLHAEFVKTRITTIRKELKSNVSLA
jgi:hypothetical protein